jgi:8-oxo-dGTP diphosphatase
MSEKVPVAGVVIRSEEGEYLIVQEKQPNAYGLWNLPAGWVDKGETFQQTAIREAKEEVGFDVELVSQEPLVSMANDSGDRMLHSFLARVIGGQLMPQSEELLDVRWMTLDNLEKLAAESKLRNKWTLESVRKAEHENHRD